MRKTLNDSGVASDAAEFREYDAFGILPQHIHKSKTEHRKAIFLLGKGLSGLGILDEAQRKRLQGRFLHLADNPLKDDRPVSTLPPVPRASGSRLPQPQPT